MRMLATAALRRKLQEFKLRTGTRQYQLARQCGWGDPSALSKIAIGAMTIGTNDTRAKKLCRAIDMALEEAFAPIEDQVPA